MLTRPTLLKLRPAFALVEMIVLIVIMAILATALIPVLAGARDRLRALEAAGEFSRLRQAYDMFRSRIGKYPGRLVDVTEPITTADRNSCGILYSASEATNWNDNTSDYGPWFREHMVTENLGYGMRATFGFVKDSLTRGGDTLIITMRDVMVSDAVELDVVMDSLSGQAGATAGEIQWGTPVDGAVTLQYRLIRSGC